MPDGSKLITTGGAIDLGNVTWIGSTTRLLLSDAGNTVDFGYIAPGARVVGGAGADSVVGGYGSLRAEGGGGNDTLVGSVSGDTLEGGDGNDLLLGSRDANRRDGYDRLDGGAGADTMIGGAGGDTYVVDSLSDQITELTGEGDDLVEAGVSWTLAANLERLTLTGTAALNGTGTVSLLACTSTLPSSMPATSARQSRRCSSSIEARDTAEASGLPMNVGPCMSTPATPSLIPRATRVVHSAAAWVR